MAIEGRDVDDPEQYKGDPIPGGPTDPDAPELAGEPRKREKMESMGTLPEGSEEPQAQSGGDPGDGEDEERSG